MTDQQTATQAAEQEIDAIMEQAQVFASAWALYGGPFDQGTGKDDAEREEANLREVIRDALSKLRAPVADERALPPLPRIPTSYLQLKNLDKIHGMMRDYARAALASAPVASAEVMDALNWVDDFIARCNRDDRGSCDSVNVLRRALASVPVAGEALQVATVAMQLIRRSALDAFDRQQHDKLIQDFAALHERPISAHQVSEAECSCPSGDGSLRHPCAAHPAKGADAGAVNG